MPDKHQMGLCVPGCCRPKTTAEDARDTPEYRRQLEVMRSVVRDYPISMRKLAEGPPAKGSDITKLVEWAAEARAEITTLRKRNEELEEAARSAALWCEVVVSGGAISEKTKAVLSEVTSRLQSCYRKR